MRTKRTFSSKKAAAAVLAAYGMLALPLSAMANEDDASKALQRPPVISLQSEAYAEVEQDTVTIYLAAEFDDALQTNVDKKLREALEAVLAEGRKQELVKVSSGNYRIYPNSDRKGAITGWRGRAEVQLESTNVAAAGELAAKMSKDMPISGLSFSVSPEARAKHEETLTEDAIKRFQSRAKQIATTMGYADYRLNEVNVGGSGGYYRPPVMRAMAADAGSFKAVSTESMPLESGTEQVSVSVNGSVYLLGGK